MHRRLNNIFDVEGILLAYIVGKCQLKSLLDEKGMSQQELALRLGVTRQQINKYVKGAVVMSYQVAYNISLILKCSMSDLYEWELRKKE